jgi:hypothetical protein
LLPHTSRYLLNAEKCRRREAGTMTRLLPALFAVANLFVCAFFERLLHNDETGRVLAIFLFIEGTAFLGLAITHYMGGCQEIILKSRTYPSTPWSRFAFVFCSISVSPTSLGLWASDFLALIILRRMVAVSAISAPVLFTLYMLTIQAGTAFVCLLASRTQYPVAAVTLLLSLGVFAVLVASLVFHADAIVMVFPPVAWTSAGVGATEVAPALWRGVLLAALAGVTALIAKRYA